MQAQINHASGQEHGQGKGDAEDEARAFTFCLQFFHARYVLLNVAAWTQTGMTWPFRPLSVLRVG
jgi:hypothetical protein